MTKFVRKNVAPLTTTHRIQITTFNISTLIANRYESHKKEKNYNLVITLQLSSPPPKQTHQTNIYIFHKNQEISILTIKKRQSKVNIKET
jgi:hypothetical protein